MHSCLYATVGINGMLPAKHFELLRLFVGTTLATGKDDARDAVGTLPPEV